jgi:uridine phosphorylase
MTFPNFENKSDSAPVFSAADVLARRQRTTGKLNFPPPEAVIFCFQSALARYVVEHYAVKKLNGFFGDLHLLMETRGRIAVASHFGIGAPVVAALTEELAAFGVRRFIALGLAGGLQPDLRAGDLVVCDRAIRDEGTSHHYLPAGKYAAADASIVAALCGALDARAQPYAMGTSWTIDAPYRETRGEVEHYRREGVKTVEMEAAALFAVGQHLQVPVGAAFVISDTFGETRWQLDFDKGAVERGLQNLFDAAVAALQKV